MSDSGYGHENISCIIHKSFLVQVAIVWNVDVVLFHCMCILGEE